MIWTTILVAARVALNGEELTCSWALLGLDLVRVLRIWMWLQHGKCGKTSFICKLWILSSNEKSEVTYFGHLKVHFYADEVAAEYLFAALWGKEWRLQRGEDVGVVVNWRSGGCEIAAQWFAAFEKKRWFSWSEELMVWKFMLRDFQIKEKRCRLLWIEEVIIVEEKRCSWVGDVEVDDLEAPENVWRLWRRCCDEKGFENKAGGGDSDVQMSEGVNAQMTSEEFRCYQSSVPWRAW